jgi:hypothetical protein
VLAGWPCPVPDAPAAEEYALAFTRGRARRLLIVPALFDEGNRLRRLTVQTMRALDAAGIDSVLPDLPGTNESLQPLAAMSLAGWRAAMAGAATHFGATHVLAIRGGALVAPDLPGLAYAPVGGSAILRQLLRARTLAGREMGREENQAALLEQGKANGLELVGYPVSAAMISELEAAEPAQQLSVIAQDEIGGGALWLRAEPGEDPVQVHTLCNAVVRALQN